MQDRAITLKIRRDGMKRLRLEGRDSWRNKKRASYNKTYYSKSRYNNFNSYQWWSIRDIKVILKKNIPDSKLSIELGRSVGAIQKIRSRMTSRKEE